MFPLKVTGFLLNYLIKFAKNGISGVQFGKRKRKENHLVLCPIDVIQISATRWRKLPVVSALMKEILRVCLGCIAQVFH